MEEAQRLYEDYKKLVNQPNPDLEHCKRLMNEVRLATTKFNVPLPSQLKAGEVPKKEIYLARDILEAAALLSLKMKDESAFQRCLTQLKTYYFDYGAFLPPSVYKFDLLGAHLLNLLAENRIGEFHTELELISSHSDKGKDHENQIKFAIKLERCKMEGSYNKMFSESSKTFPDYYNQFTEKLVQTSRNDIADALEKVYEELTVSHAMDILLFKDANALQVFIGKRGWQLHQGDKIKFAANEEIKREIGAPQLIAQNLRYANELERII